MAKNDYTVIDLFAGCGGLSLGLFQAGWHGVFAIEKNPCAFETLKYNLIDGKKHFAWPKWLPKEPLDILEVNTKYENELRGLRGTIDLVAGGPPCQGFSMAGKRVKDDLRNQLVFAYIDFISMVMPRLILFENVKGFTYPFGKKEDGKAIPYSVIVVNRLRELGYEVCPQVIDFSEFCVPQRRKRFILVGVLHGEEGISKSFMDKLYANRKAFLSLNGLKANTTITDAISDLLRSNGEVETPDRKGFKSGLYGEERSAYQHFMRTGIKSPIPNSHSFAKHTAAKQSLFDRLIKEYPEKGKRIDGKAREPWGIKQRGLFILVCVF